MINIDCCFFVLVNEKNENKRKNDDKVLKVLLDKKGNLVSIPYKEGASLKEQIREKIKNIIGSNNFHLEQVYTLGEKKYNKKDVNVIYLGITNEENIKNLDNKYELVEFDVKNKNIVSLNHELIEYDTKLKKEVNSLEYYHVIKTNDINLEKKILELLISYKQIISKLDYTDIIFKFLPKYYALEDVRIIYEKIKNVSVDKSNFRKKVMKYSKTTNKIISGKGYRPTQLYEFVLDEKDIWI